MRKLFALLLLFGIALVAQNTQVTIPPPPPVQVITPNIFGGTGSTQYLYVVVAIYPVGKVYALPITVNNGPATLTGGNYVGIFWNAVPVGNLAADSQTNAGALILGSAVQALENGEDAVQIFFIKPDAVIFNNQP